jgi:hypothetical protein
MRIPICSVGGFDGYKERGLLTGAARFQTGEEEFPGIIQNSPEGRIGSHDHFCRQKRARIFTSAWQQMASDSSGFDSNLPRIALELPPLDRSLF